MSGFVWANPVRLLSAPPSYPFLCANQLDAFSSSLLPPSLRTNFRGASENFLVSFRYLIDLQRDQQIANAKQRLEDNKSSEESLAKRKLSRIHSIALRANTRRDLLDTTAKLNHRISSLAQSIRQKSSYVECGLRDEEIFAIFMYTTTLYRQINPILRENDPSKIARIQAFVATINSGLEKIADYKGSVVRGVNLPDQIRKEYCIDCVVSDRAFTSSSINRQYPGRHWMKILSSKGKFIAPLSSSPSVNEVLFKPATQFQVKKILSSRDPKGKPIEKFELVEIP